MQTILITGVSGFIGGHLWNKLANNKNVHGTYYSHGALSLHPERQYKVNFNNSGEIRNLINKLKPRCILHLAAKAGIRDCQQNNKLAWQVNNAATIELVQAAEEISSRIIYISTDCVFNGRSGSYREGDPVDPLSVYGETKATAEKNVFNISSDAVVVRINNTYGKPVFAGSSFSEWVLTRHVKGEPITLFTDQYRSFIDIITLTNALIELIDHQFKGLLHLGGANRLNRVTFGRLLLDHLGYDASSVIKVKNSDLDPQGLNPLDSSFDITLARQILKTDFPRIHEAFQLAYPRPSV